ncbi:MAG TPA: CHAD domain-containing protein, partial [Candidatus Binatus sp.]|nr:CHAD domain-containing protein [Candidatus Binatus sp.]
LKRIFREEIESAVRLCRHPARQRGATVHEVRKHLKKLRAALRLTKTEVGKNRWASEDLFLREIGRLVSDLRDAHVRYQTLIQLRDDADQQFPRIEELLSMEQESFSAAFAGWQKRAIPKLERAGERLSKWPLSGITWKQICGVVAKVYRRGQNRLAKALKKRDPESFHVWRMSVKELWYQLRILRPLNRLVLEEIASDAKTLGELLGSAHDFAFLLARLDRERGDEALYDELVQLQKLIQKRGKQLHRDALELGRRFYAEPSKAFAKRISIFIDKRKAKS